MKNPSKKMADPLLFAEIRTEKVYIQVVNQIRELINAGKLNPGDKLPPEKILADRLGVSRPSIREGIVALEILGLAESRGGKGNFITSPVNNLRFEQKFGDLEKEESPFELLEARKTVEVEVAGYAAKKSTDEDVARMKQTLDTMGKLVEAFLLTKDYQKPFEYDRQFHIDVAKAAHNKILQRIVIQLLETLKEDLWVKLKAKSWNTPGRAQKYLKEHEEIFFAIQNRDSKKARKTMRQHLTGIQMDLFGKA